MTPSAETQFQVFNLTHETTQFLKYFFYTGQSRVILQWYCNIKDYLRMKTTTTTKRQQKGCSSNLCVCVWCVVCVCSVCECVCCARVVCVCMWCVYLCVLCTCSVWVWLCMHACKCLCTWACLHVCTQVRASICVCVRAVGLGWKETLHQDNTRLTLVSTKKQNKKIYMFSYTVAAISA